MRTSQRLPRLAAALVFPLLTVIVLSILAQHAITSGGTGASGRTTGFDGSLRPPGLRAPDFRLHDERGRVVTMREFRGQDVVVTFMYSTCKDTCPLTAQQIRGALDELGHDVPVLAISVDPVADTPAHVRGFLTRQHVVGRIHYLVGSHAELAPVWRAYGIQPQSSESEHTASTVVVDRSGMQRVGYLTVQLTPEALAHDLRKLGAPGGARAAS